MAWIREWIRKKGVVYQVIENDKSIGTFKKREDAENFIKGRKAVKAYPDLADKPQSQRIVLAVERDLAKLFPAGLPDNDIVVKAGDWWQLGDHLLYCGDTSTPEFINKIPHCTFAFADPPYNEGVAEWDNDFRWAHDWLIDKADIVAVTPGISAISDFMKITQMPYKWSISTWISNGMTRGALGFGNWIYIALFTNNSLYRNAQDFFKIEDDKITVSIDISTTQESNHKGRKPLALLNRLIILFTSPRNIIVDPFLGSGTTLFVADKNDRRCIGGEISAAFCKDIITRWNKYHPTKMGSIIEQRPRLKK